MTVENNDHIKTGSRTDNSFNEALREAEYQVEAMTGSWDARVRFRLIDQRYDVPKENRQNLIQLCGSLDNDDFCKKLFGHNQDGYDVYIVAQEVNDTLPDNAPVSGRDIVSGRVLVADFDDQEYPDDTNWHLEPTFILRRENSDRHFWIGWRTEPYAADQISDAHKRIIQLYGSDPTVSDRARIMRLAGFESHKREAKTRYVIENGREALKPSSLAAHKLKLPEIKRKAVSASDTDSDDYVSEKRLRFQLGYIDPECDRHLWISILGAIKDADIGRDDRTYMEFGDKYELADEWSSGMLGKFDPTNYQDCDDVFNNLESLSRDNREINSTVGTIVKAAKKAGMDELAHRRLRQAEVFKHPDNAKNTKDRAPEHNVENERNSRFRIVNRAGMEEILPPEWLVPEFLVENTYAMLAGGPGTFKTFIALDIALSVVTGSTSGVWPKINRAGPVLFAAGEGRSQIITRVKAWERKHYGGEEAKDFTLIDPVPLIAQEEYWEEFIEYALRAHPDGYQLVVLDTVGRAMQGLNENTQEHASNFTRLTDMLRRELRATVLALHHTGHDTSARARGSSVFGADVDTMLMLKRVDKKLQVELDMTKQKDAPEWEAPKIIQLEKISLSPIIDSLVAVNAPDAAEKSEHTGRPPLIGPV